MLYSVQSSPKRDKLRQTVNGICAEYFNGKVQKDLNKKETTFLSAGYIYVGFGVCTHVCTYVHVHLAARRSELVSSARKLSYRERKPNRKKGKILPMESITILLHFIVIRTVDHNTIS